MDKKGELKRFWLEAVDGNGEIVPYSPDNWYCSYDSNMVYKAFNFVWNWTPVLLKADGEPKLDGIVKGKNTETEASGIGRNYVEMQSLGMETDDSKIHMNSQSISFGGENRTAYRPNGKAEIHVSRVINVYDAKANWKYLTDADGTQLKDIKDADIPEVQVLSTSEYIDLNINLETIIRLGEGVNRKNEPEISSQSVKWFLEGRPVFSGDDICRFGIKENEIGKAQLSVGTNRISVEFLDTAGFSYQREIHVKVPSEVAYVELAQDEYVLANLNQEIDGVSSLPLEYVLYDAEGEPVYDNMENEAVKNAYTVEWTTGAEPCPFKLIADSTSNMEKVVSKTIGNGTIFLKVKERASGREIVGEDGQPATAAVVVKPMELSLALRYNSGQGGTAFVTIESGKMIPVFSNTAGLITGFNASLKLPEEISNRLTEGQKNNLEKAGWDKISWKMTGPALYWASQEQNTNVYNAGYNYGIGTVKFEASANMDAAVNGLISVAVNEAPAVAVSVKNVYGNDFNELVIGAGADRANDQYNSVTLRANVEGQGGKDCDKSVIWTIRSGKELVDTRGGVWNIEVDSEDQRYYPKVRLKSGLTEEDAGKKIVVRATSASSGKHADYTITILPQFKITYPYSEKFTLVHMSEGESDSKNSVPGSRTIEANRDADWEIKKAQEYLVFDGNTEKTSKVTIVTQKIVNDVVTYNVEAKDSLTGQTDSRTVIVEFEKIEEQKEHNDGWALHFNPNGVFYMDIGEKKEFEASSSSTIVSMGRELTQEGDISSVNSRYSYSLNIFGLSYKGTLYVEASEPGTVTFYSRSLIFGIRSAEYVKIIVRGLEFDKTSYTTDISEKTYNMKSVLNSGDIDLDSCIWESSNRNIATINDSGTVSLLKPGKTTITVSGRANSNGKAFTSQCELIVTATGWGTVNSISNKWENNVGSSVVLMAGSGQYGNAEMSPTISGSSLYPVYYTVESESEGKAANGILRTEGRTAIAQGEGKVKITAGAADKVSSPLYAEIYELKSISVKLKKIGDSEAGEDDSGKNILNFITDGPKSLTLKSDLIWGSYSAENIQRIPAEFKKYIWEIDEKSKEYVDLVTNSDGTCTVTAKGMGAAYITCRSVANPDIYETYVVIVSF